MMDLLEDVDLLEDLLPGEVILHVALLKRLNSHVPACEFVSGESDFSKRSFSNQLLELVEVESCWRDRFVFSDVSLYILDGLLPLLNNRLLNLNLRLSILEINSRLHLNLPSSRNRLLLLLNRDISPPRAPLPRGELPS